jgi:hypothetical protein
MIYRTLSSSLICSPEAFFSLKKRVLTLYWPPGNTGRERNKFCVSKTELRRVF